MRFRHLAERLAGYGEWVGVVAILIILTLTAVDVVGAKVFRSPLRGATELVGLAQVVAVGGAMAMGLFKGRHITIEFFVSRLPRFAQVLTRGLISLLGLGLFGVLAWKSFTYGHSLRTAGQITSTAAIPFYPFAYVLALFAALAVLYYMAELIATARGDSKA